VGLRLAPMTITTGVAATLSGRLAEAFGARRVMRSACWPAPSARSCRGLFGVAQGPFVLAALLLGTGGATLPLIVASALAEVPSQRAGIASGVVNAARRAAVCSASHASAR